MKDNLTVNKLKALKPPAKGNLIVWDESRGAPSGFGVRITAAGAVSFVLNYRNAHRESRRFTIGQFPEVTLDAAREEAIALCQQIKKGADPVQEKQDERKALAAPPQEPEPTPETTTEKTVKELAAAYMSRHVLINNSVAQQKNAGYYIKNNIEPRFGNRKLSAVTTMDVSDLQASMAKHRYSANQCFTVLRAMYNKGILWGWCTNNPTKGLKKYVEDKRQTWLEEQQFTRLDRAITEYNQDSGELTGELIRLLLLSGSRRGEWMRAKKEDFDLVHGIWTKPSHTVKERHQEYLQLNDATMIVLKRVIANTAASEPYLFQGKGKEKGPRVTVRRAWIQILRRAGLAEEYTIPGARGPLKRWRPKIRLHDLRHSYASWLAENGVPLKKIGQLLGHQQVQTTDRYAHIADKSLRSATNLFGDAISKLVQ